MTSRSRKQQFAAWVRRARRNYRVFAPAGGWKVITRDIHVAMAVRAARWRAKGLR